MARRARASWNEDLAGRLRFEREATQAGLVFTVHRTAPPGHGRRWIYKTAIDIPAFDERRQLEIVLPPHTGQRPTVTVDGPFCGRHRFNDGSLCMWWARDPTTHQWVADDGLLALVEHAVEHCYCEASCRRGLGWPKPEAPRPHPESCASCRPR